MSCACPPGMRYHALNCPVHPGESREARRQKLANAEMEFRRGLVALRLEVPAAVWGDINLRFAAFREAAWEAHNRV